MEILSEINLKSLITRGSIAALWFNLVPSSFPSGWLVYSRGAMRPEVYVVEYACLNNFTCADMDRLELQKDRARTLSSSLGHIFICSLHEDVEVC